MICSLARPRFPPHCPRTGPPDGVESSSPEAVPVKDPLVDWSENVKRSFPFLPAMPATDERLSAVGVHRQSVNEPA